MSVESPAELIWLDISSNPLPDPYNLYYDGNDSRIVIWMKRDDYDCPIIDMANIYEGKHGDIRWSIDADDFQNIRYWAWLKKS